MVRSFLRGEPVIGPPARQTATPAAAGGAASPTLEREGNNVSASPAFVFRPCGCNKRVCPWCGGRRGHLLRERMLDKLHLFSVGRLLTLTVDGEGTKTGRGFDGPEAAYEYVRQHRLIPRLFARMGIRTWICVMEFQKNGMPHWHVLYDCSEFPGHFVDYKKLHSLWRDEFGVGLCHDSGVKFLGDPTRAVNYITAYLTKHPEGGYPPWVWFRLHQGVHRAIRFVSASRSIGRLVMPDEVSDGVSDVEPAESDAAECDERSRQFAWSTYYQDVSSCGSRCRVFRRTSDGAGGETHSFVGELPVSVGHLVGDAKVAAVCATLGVHPRAVDQEIDWCGRRRWTVEAPVDASDDVFRVLAMRLGDLRAGWSEFYSQRMPVSFAVGYDTMWCPLPPLTVAVAQALEWSSLPDESPGEAEGGSSQVSEVAADMDGSCCGSGVPPLATSDT